MHDTFEILWRSILTFVILIVFARILGKEVVSNMTFHDFVTGITIGAIAANLAFNVKIKAMDLILSLVAFMAVSFLVSVITMKFRKSRLWLSGTPTVVIERGKILEKNMSKIKYTIDSLNQSLRQKGIFNIGEVEYAVLEVNGELAIMKKDEYNTVTKKDLELNSSDSIFPIELIIDGKILEKNFTENHISKRNVQHQITKMNKRLEDVFYAVQGSNGKLYIDLYEQDIDHPIDKE
jgi:uncharacterized membrane protein YcaP (DUF421 family)